MQPIQIQQITIALFPEQIKANYAIVSDIAVNLMDNAYATVIVGNLDENDNFIQMSSVPVNMTHEEYLDWGEDDQYAINLFLQKAGVVKI